MSVLAKRSISPDSLNKPDSARLGLSDPPHQSTYPPTRLSDTKINTLTPPHQQVLITDLGQPNLILRVGAGGHSKSWVLSYYNQDGKRQRYTIGKFERFNTKQARKRARDLLKQVQDGICPQTEKKQHRESHEFQLGIFTEDSDGEFGVPESQKNIILSAFQQFSETPIQNLTVERLERWTRARLVDGIKPSTLNRQRSALIAVVNRGVDLKLIKINPIKGWKPLKVPTEPRVRFLNTDERARLEAGLNHRDTEPVFADMVRVYLNTGLRQSELFTLRWSDVNLDMINELCIRAENNKSNRTRYIPLNAGMISIFTKYRDLARTENPDYHQHLVFPSPRKPGMPRTSLKTAWAGLMRRSGIVGFRRHDMRHDFASRLISSGQVDLYVLRDLLGHKDIRTSQRYSHLDPKKMKAAVSVLDG